MILNKSLTNPILVEDKYGSKRWYNERHQLHRENDLPAVERSDGSKSWWINGKLHRENGLPAREYDGHKVWYLDGVCCRFDEWIDYFT